MRVAEIAIGAIVALGMGLLIFGRSSSSVQLANATFSGTNQLFGTLGKSVS